MSFTDEMTTTTTDALKVSGYAALIKRAVATVGPAVVEGEIQDITFHSNGMAYFDISDGDATLRGTVFRREVARLTHRPKKGDLVRIDIDRPDFYPANGRLSVIVRDIRLAGAGELLARRQELLTRLHAEGLCDSARWRPVPRFAQVVGVIAAEGSKGMGDVVEALKKRFPPVQIKTCAASVQGVFATGQVLDALVCLAAQADVEVIVIARGGGSIFDMVAFDDERLCRAVWACGKPVVVGIGHTEDDNVINHVTWAAETPSKTPELAVPSAAELAKEIALARQSISCVGQRIDRSIEQTANLAARLDVAGQVEQMIGEISEVDYKLDVALERFISTREETIRSAAQIVATIPTRMTSPEAVAAISARIDAHSQIFFSQRESTLAVERQMLARAVERLDDLSASVTEEGARIATGLQRVAADHEQNFTRALDRLREDLATAAFTGIDARASAVAEHGQRLSTGLRRVAAAHEDNYTRALERIRREMAAAAKTRLALEEREISAATTELKRQADQRIADAERDLRLLVAEISSHNPMTHGYVLASDEDGRPLRSTTALSIGQPVSLQFIDGRARTTVDHIETA